MRKRLIKIMFDFKKLKCTYNSNRFFFNFLFIWIIVFLILRTIQHFSFGTNACDLSVFDYGIYYSLKGKIMFEPFHAYRWGSHFSIHFTPILLFIVPLYLILKGPLFLLYIQVLIVGASSVPLYFIAKHYSGNKKSATILTIVYLLYRPLLNGLMYDFHPEMFFPFFIFAGFYYLKVKEKPMLFYLFSFLALLIKENFSIYLFFYGLFLVFYEKKRKYGIILSFLSIVYALITFNFIIPYFRVRAGLSQGYEFIGAWKAYGSSAMEIIKSVLLNPFIFLKDLNIIRTLLKLFDLLLSLLFLPVFSVFSLLIIPPVLICILSRIPLMSSFELYYVAPLIPFLFLGLVHGYSNISKHIVKFDINTKKALRIKEVILILLLVINIANTKWNLFDLKQYRLLKDYPSFHSVVSIIDKDDSIASLSSLIPHISKRRHILILPEINNAKYILIHTKANCWPMKKKELSAFVKKVKNSDFYKLIKQKGDIYLFEKKQK